MNRKYLLRYICSLLIAFTVHTVTHAQMRKVHLENHNAVLPIQKMSFFSPSEGYIAAMDDIGQWIGYTSDSGRTIAKRYLQGVPIDYNGYSVNLPFLLQGVEAISRDTIVVYGGFNLTPAILYSTNGGASYLLTFHSQVSATQIGWVYDMSFPQHNGTGYAVDGFRVLKTINKGRNWIIVNQDPNSTFGGVDGIDGNNVFVFSTNKSGTGNKIMKTSNGGLTWQPINFPHGMISADFITNTRGWINVADNDQRSLVYYTANGGTTWTQKNYTDAENSYFIDMSFINDSTGFAIGGGAYETYKTSDSGRVWEPLPRDNNALPAGGRHNDIAMINNNQLWAGGWSTFIELNTNIGANPLPKAYFGIDMSNVTTTGQVLLKNFSRTNYQYRWLVNTVQISTNYNASYIHSLPSPVDSIELIVTYNGISDTLKQYRYFSIPNAPVIYSFSPAAGSTGSLITLRGIRFTGATSVKFGNTPAQSFTVVNDTTIRAVVGSGATGPVFVGVGLTSYSLPQFTYLSPVAGIRPVLTSFNPASGPAGTTVTITGTGFAASPDDNIVWFGTAKAVITSASPTTIVCTVPKGADYKPVQVINKANGLAASSIKPFNVTFPQSGNFTGHSFVDGHLFTFYDRIVEIDQVKGADFDMDGKPDVMAGVGWAGDSMYVFRNTSVPSHISFEPPKKFKTFTFLADLGDIDGDGKLDILTASPYSTAANVSDFHATRNTSTPGAISFAPVMERRVPHGIKLMKLVDIDGDGRKDILMTHDVTLNMNVILNTSSPGFISFANDKFFTLPFHPGRGDAGDLNGDGKPDLAIWDRDGVVLQILPNNSTPGNVVFGTPVPVTGPNDYGGIHLQDIDGDGKLDAVHMGSARIQVNLNTSTGGNISFGPALVIQPAQAEAFSSMIANLSGDDRPDFATNGFSNTITSYRRNRSYPGTVATDPQLTPMYPFEYGNVSVDDIDFDMDGKVDIVMADNTQGFGNQVVRLARNGMGDSVRLAPSCAGFTRTIATDVPGTNYQWQENTGSGFVNITDNSIYSGTSAPMLFINNSPLSLNGRKYRCKVDTLLSSVFYLAVNSVATVSASISTASTTVCAGTEVRFDAVAVNGGPNPIYRWYKNGLQVGTNSSFYIASSVNNNDQIQLEFFPNIGCTTGPASSNTITMTVTGIAPTLSIATTGACPGQPSTFTATALNAGTQFSYQWQINGVDAGTNSPVFTTSALQAGNQVRVLMTDTTACGAIINLTSNTITVPTGVNPSVSIAASSTTVCAGSNVIFTATPVNGGSNPSYQWTVNGVNAGANSNTFSTSSLVTGSVVRVILTTSVVCATSPTATSNPVTITVNNSAAPSVTITASATSICPGLPVTFTAVAVNGGNNPSYQWQVNGVNAGNNSTVFTTTALGNGDQVKVIMTGNAPCATAPSATSNVITISSSANTTPSVSIATPSNTICTGGSITFTATPVNGGSTPTYQWQVNGVNAGTNSPAFTGTGLSNGAQVKVIMTSSSSCVTPSTATSNIITVTVNSTVTPSVTITTPATVICNGSSATFTATTVNGGVNPSYQWKVNGASVGTNSPVYISASLTNNAVVNVVMTSNALCVTPATATSNTITMSVSNLQQSTITIHGTTTVTAGQSTALGTTIAFGGNTPQYQWQDSTAAHNWQNIPGATTGAHHYTPSATGDKVRCQLTPSVSCPGSPFVLSNALRFTLIGGRTTMSVLRPNPVHTTLYIDSLQLTDRWEQLEIINMSAAKVITPVSIAGMTSASVDVTRLPAGHYVAILSRRSGDKLYLNFIKL